MDMPSSPDGDIARLLAIMARLRDPDGGCPWDLEQTHETLKRGARMLAGEMVRFSRGEELVNVINRADLVP